MLDLKKLDKVVTELISNATKEDFERWLIMDDQRMMESFIRDGCPLHFTNQRFKPNKIKFQVQNPPQQRVLCY
jgi:hypothetical protein